MSRYVYVRLCTFACIRSPMCNDIVPFPTREHSSIYTPTMNRLILYNSAGAIHLLVGGLLLFSRSPPFWSLADGLFLDLSWPCRQYSGQSYEAVCRTLFMIDSNFRRWASFSKGRPEWRNPAKWKFI